MEWEKTFLSLAIKIEGDMKRVNKKWRGGQEGIVVGGTWTEKEGTAAAGGGGENGEGNGGGGEYKGWENVCLKENKREIKRGGCHRQKEGWGRGISPDKICANVCVNESSAYS